MAIKKKPSRLNVPYKPGELETILSLVPTENNIKWLSKLLDRSEQAIEVVYKMAYEHGHLGQKLEFRRKKLLRLRIRSG